MATFSLNAETNPDSANAHDSLGEACRATGDLRGAIKSYERSFELQPDGRNADAARAALAVLKGEQGAKTGDR